MKKQLVIYIFVVLLVVSVASAVPFEIELQGGNDPVIIFETDEGEYYIADAVVRTYISKETGEYRINVHDNPEHQSGDPGLYCRLDGNSHFTRFHSQTATYSMTELRECFSVWNGIPNKELVRKYQEHGLDDYMIEVHAERGGDPPKTGCWDIAGCDTHTESFDDHWCVYSHLCPEKGILSEHCIACGYNGLGRKNTDAQKVSQGTFKTENKLYFSTYDYRSGHTSTYDPRVTFIPVETLTIDGDVDLSSGPEIEIFDIGGYFEDVFGQPIKIYGEGVYFFARYSESNDTHDPQGHIYACADADDNDWCDHLAENKAVVCNNLGGDYNGVPDIDEEDFSNTVTINGGSDGCCGDDPAPYNKTTGEGDLGFIDDTQHYFCNYNSTSDTWDWLNAQLQNYDYRIYPFINKTEVYTNVLSNSDNWSYCDATGRSLLRTGAIGENEVLPEPSLANLLDDSDYQYWPDENCDGYADCDSPPYDNIQNNGENWDHYCYPEPHHPCEYSSLLGTTYQNDSGWDADCDRFVENCFEDVPGEGCPENDSNSYAGTVEYDKYLWVGAFDPGEDCIHEGLVPGGCSNQMDDDGDGYVDCQDFDCALDEACAGEFDIYQVPPRAIVNEFLCYEQSNIDYFGECCPYGEPCDNIKATNGDALENRNYLSTGSHTHMLASFDFPPRLNISIARLQRRDYENSVVGIFPPQKTSWDDFGFLSFNIIFNNDLTVKLIDKEGFTSRSLLVNDYSTSGNNMHSFNRVRILLSDFDFNGRIIAELFFTSVDGEGFTFDIDSVYLEASGSNAGASKNRMCSRQRTWIEDMDAVDYDSGDIYSYAAEKSVCNYQNPPGYGGFGWTGSACCGDDTLGYYDNYVDSCYGGHCARAAVEYYPDLLAGCWAGNKVFSNQRVSEAIGDENLTNVLFVNQGFWACDSLDYKDMKIIGKSGAPGENLVTNVPPFSMKGVWFCSPEGEWKLINESGKIAILAAKFFDIATEHMTKEFTLFCDVQGNTLNDHTELPNDLVDNFCVLRHKDDKDIVIIGTATVNKSLIGVRQFIDSLNRYHPLLPPDHNISQNICDDVHVASNEEFLVKCNMTGTGNITIYYNDYFDFVVFSQNSEEVLDALFIEPGFFKEMWDAIIDFFKRIFGMQSRNFPLTQEEALFDKMYIAVLGDRVVKAVFEERDDTNYSKISFGNFTNQAISEDYLEASSDSYDFVGCNDLQSITLTNPENHLWLYLTSTLRLKAVGDADGFGDGSLTTCGELFGNCEEVGQEICCGAGAEENFIMMPSGRTACCNSPNDVVDEDGYCVIPCSEGMRMVCYTGPDRTQDVGECENGTRTCLSHGLWGECGGALVLPEDEVCTGKLDEDCDGLIDRLDLDCQICIDEDNDGYGNPENPPYCPEDGWDCEDHNPDINPGVVEICGNGIDNDCNNLTDCDDPFCKSTHPDCFECGQEITQSVTLTVDIPDCPRYGLNITADNLVLDCNGKTISGTGVYYGINMDGQSNVTIKNCFITNFSRGMQITNSQDIEISDNIVTDNHEGIRLHGTSDSKVQYNVVERNKGGFGLGMVVDLGDNNEILFNSILHNDNGLKLYNAQNTVVRHNEICANEEEDMYCFNAGIAFEEQNHCDSQAPGHECSDISCEPCGEMSWIHCGDTITENTILNFNLINCDGTGLVIGEDGITLDCQDFMIRGRGSGEGIDINSKNDVTIKNCQINNFRIGIYMDNAYDNNILNNRIFDNFRDGIHIYFSTNNLFEGNVVSENNHKGINIDHSSDYNTFRSNTVNENGDHFTGDGFFISNAAENLVFISNTACDNTQYDFHCEEDFSSNTQQTSDNTCEETSHYCGLYDVTCDNDCPDDGGGWP